MALTYQDKHKPEEYRRAEKEQQPVKEHQV